MKAERMDDKSTGKVSNTDNGRVLQISCYGVGVTYLDDGGYSMALGFDFGSVINEWREHKLLVEPFQL